MGTRADFVRKKYGPLARKTLPNPWRAAWRETFRSWEESAWCGSPPSASWK